MSGSVCLHFYHSNNAVVAKTGRWAKQEEQVGESISANTMECLREIASPQ